MDEVQAERYAHVDARENLPCEHIAFGVPSFAIKGIDYLGSFYVFIKRSPEKRGGKFYPFNHPRSLFPGGTSMDASNVV